MSGKVVPFRDGYYPPMAVRPPINAGAADNLKERSCGSETHRISNGQSRQNLKPILSSPAASLVTVLVYGDMSRDPTIFESRE